MSKIQDLTGQKFKRLTVIKRVENDKWGTSQWLCECDCGSGKEVIARANSLKNGDTGSCGCLRKEMTTLKNTHDLTGKVFGKLTVIKRGEDYISPNGRKQPRWWCQCECNGENSLKLIQGGALVSGYTQSCGCLQKEKASKIFKKYNTYDLTGEYGIGYTFNDEEFYFDIEDYDLIKDYCWRLDKDGYAITNFDNKHIKMHRLVMNCPDDMEIDHEFHDEWDNRKEFLRIVTHPQNQRNQGLQSNNTSGVTGVCWHKWSEKWQAYIEKDGKRINLGLFDNFNEAVEVRKNAELEYFGEYRYKK